VFKNRSVKRCRIARKSDQLLQDGKRMRDNVSSNVLWGTRRITSGSGSVKSVKDHVLKVRIGGFEICPW
jgi:hypothetical protein